MHHPAHAPNAPKCCSLKCLVLCRVNFTSGKQMTRRRRGGEARGEGLAAVSWAESCRWGVSEGRSGGAGGVP